MDRGLVIGFSLSPVCAGIARLRQICRRTGNYAEQYKHSYTAVFKFYADVFKVNVLLGGKRNV